MKRLVIEIQKNEVKNEEVRYRDAKNEVKN